MKRESLSPTQKERSVIEKNPAGFSTVEAILAASVLALLITALAGSYLYGEEATALAGTRRRAVFLAEEALEAMRNIRDSAWNELHYNQSTVEIDANQWEFSGEGSTDVVDIFTRTITFADVCRDGSDAIAACPAVYTDPHMKQATASVDWTTGNTPRSVSASTYITNWNSTNWTQTDWAGGSGQSIWSDSTKYFSESGVDNGTAGKIQLAAAPDGSWSVSGGSSFIDTSDTDFGQGTVTDTAVSGAGADADVRLAVSPTNEWALEPSTVTAQNLNDIVAVSATDVWAVANGGEVHLHRRLGRLLQAPHVREHALDVLLHVARAHLQQLKLACRERLVRQGQLFQAVDPFLDGRALVLAGVLQQVQRVARVQQHLPVVEAAARVQQRLLQRAELAREQAAQIEVAVHHVVDHAQHQIGGAGRQA